MRSHYCGQLNLDQVAQTVALGSSSLNTPATRLEFSGTLADPGASGLEQGQPVIVNLQDDPATFPQIANTYWWSGPPDPHGWLRYWKCGDEVFATSIGYCNPEYDALVEEFVVAAHLGQTSFDVRFLQNLNARSSRRAQRCKQRSTDAASSLRSLSRRRLWLPPVAYRWTRLTMMHRRSG
jgi:hypothetical protein